MVCPLAVAAADSANIPALVQKAKPAIVEILTYDQQNKLLKTGTGFFISPDGLLLTNYHVISGGSSITAKMPNKAIFFLKSIVTASETYDIAELQFFATDVPYLTLGSSLTAVEGQRVLVIGNPEGLEGTVSDGIISAFRANRTMIQITAPVSPGSSGSPVLDESGNVIGIETQVSKEGQNLNFAISAETIRDAIAKSAVVVVTPTPSVARGSAEDYFNRADREMRNRNYQSAIIDYTEAIRLKPDWAQAYSDRGNAYFNLGQYDKATNDYTEGEFALLCWS
jgi:S1-C subfamily serine protease